MTGMSRRIRATRPLWIGALLLLAGPEAVLAQGVHAALTPISQAVAPGSEFDIEITVTEAGSAFNGFEAVVSYDPAALTFLPASPISLQRGCLMTGACSAACGNTFHVFSAAGDSLRVNLGLLCDQFSLTGPGQVYKLRFQASTTTQLTALSFRRAGFFDAGLLVVPLVLDGCTVTIGTPVGVEPARMEPRLEVRARPNPFRGAVELTIEADEAGEAELRVIDLLGRTIRRLSTERMPAGARHVEWDGKDESGAVAPPGIYRVRLRMGSQIRQTRVTKLW